MTIDKQERQDMRKIIILLSLIVSFAAIVNCRQQSISTDVLVGPVPDTGQRRNYTATWGEDSDYTINIPSYTKLDARGNALPDSADYSKTPWAMVMENVTGLIWEVKDSKDGTSDYSNPHDADNTYTWYDSNTATNGGNAGIPGDGTDAEDFINDLNAANFGGFSDWRLPTIKELSFIANKGVNNPAIDKAYFPNTVARYYWSSTTYADNTGDDWQVIYSL